MSTEETTRETFGRICERVCREQGWALLPSGVQVTWGDGRHQIVALEFFERQSEELVRLYTRIGSAGDLGPERLKAALRVNFDLAHGALALRDGDLVMVETLMANDADASEIEATIRYLADTADQYERMLFGTDDN